jgi:hypothetical protein
MARKRRSQDNSTAVVAVMAPLVYVLTYAIIHVLR